MCCTQATSKVHKCIQEQATPPRKHKTVSRNRQLNISQLKSTRQVACTQTGQATSKIQNCVQEQANKH